MPTDQELNHNPFGTGQTWLDVGSYIRRVLRGKFFSLRRDPDLLAEIISSVLLDLIDYWTTLPSSKTESGWYSWTKAVNRGVKFGTRAVWDEVQHHQAESPARWMLEHDEPYEHHFDALEDDEMIGLAHKVLSSFSHDELQEFFAGILGDTSTREDAAIYGVSHMTIARKRQAQREKLRQRAREMGLLDA